MESRDDLVRTAEANNSLMLRLIIVAKERVRRTRALLRRLSGITSDNDSAARS